MSTILQEIERLEALVIRLKNATTSEQQAIELSAITIHTDRIARLIKSNVKITPQQALANTYVVSSDFWATMARELKINRINTVVAFDKWAYSFERDFRNKNKVAYMPSAYRSSKSILRRAIQHGVAFTDHHGNILGKTMVQRKIDGLTNI